MAGRDGQSVVRSEPVASRTRRLDADRIGGTEGLPARALTAYAGPRVAWMAPGEASVVGCGVTATVECSGPDRYETVRQAGEALLSDLTVDALAEAPGATDPRLLGGFSFHQDFDATPPWRGFAGARFVLPHVQLVETGEGVWVTVTGRGPDATEDALETAIEDVSNRLSSTPRGTEPPPGIVSTERVPDRDGWRRQVETVLSHIEAGNIRKVVLAQRLTARLGGAFRLPDVLDRLAVTYPECFRFAVDPGMGATFFGATPERLVSVSGSDVETEALAGSIPRGGTEAEDDRLARSLAESPKARHEHALVVETIRDRLEAMTDDVTVDDRSVRRLANVQHLRTPISAQTDPADHVLSVVAALHPTPAVGGLPPGSARELIASTERFERGWYASPVGWFDATGDGSFAVAIRSALATNASTTLFAGNGIVRDSDPDEEWDELQLKYRPILDQLR